MRGVGLIAGWKAGAEFSRRRLSLLGPPPDWVRPRAPRTVAPIEAVLVLQRGTNPTTDYYIRPRLPLGLPSTVVDLTDDPADCEPLGDGRGLWVVICRYVSEPWLRELERARPARVSFFADDDLPAIQADGDLPEGLRGKVGAHYGRHVDRLSALVDDVWVSTPTLAAAHLRREVTVLPPVPEADPPAGERIDPPLVVYHGTDSHAAERRFVLEVARIIQARAAHVRFEVTGDERLERTAADLPNVRIVRQTAWPVYRDEQAGRRASVFLAPLLRSRVNASRAPVKAFDAARLGAAAVFANHPVYEGWVRPGVDGVLATMTPEAFAETVLELLRDEGRRLALVSAARDRLIALRRDAGGLPGAPA